MLKKIRVDQLRLGMHVHRLEGAWLDHPFWKTQFELSDPSDLAKLRDSPVRECWIDGAKGLDVQTPAAASAPVPEPAPSSPAALPSPPPARTPIVEEAQRAAALCAQARQAVRSLFDATRLGHALDAEGCVPLVDEIASSVWRNPGALVSLARLKTHDDYTYMHSVAACALMVSLAQQLGQDAALVRSAGMAGLLHDIGKAVMPLEVLNKPGPLVDAEYAVMRSHPVRGHQLLHEGRAVGEIELDVCLHHHERVDGKGYPERLSGEALSLQARMGSICDVYDAITSNRPYKDGWDPAESIARMAEWTKAGQFDSRVFHAFVSRVGIYPIGCLVRLQSGRLAVVVEQSTASLTTPSVKVFFSTKSGMPLAPETVDLSRPGCSDRILARESNAHWAFPHLAELVPGYESLRQGAGAVRS